MYLEDKEEKCVDLYVHIFRKYYMVLRVVTIEAYAFVSYWSC